MTLWISTLIKWGTKKAVHVQASTSRELVEVANEFGVGVRNAGEKHEHITLNIHQARVLTATHKVEQLEGDIYK